MKSRPFVLYEPYLARDYSKVDKKLLDSLGDRVPKMTEKLPADVQRYKDFRHLLDRKDIDAVVISTPDHWHAIQTIMACQAEKDVYVEKPLSLTIVEGRKMVEAARKYNQIVQSGTQRRSDEAMQEVVPLDIQPVFCVTRHGIRFSAFDFTSQPYVCLRLYLAQRTNANKPGSVMLNVLDEEQWTEWLAAMRVGFGAELGDPVFSGPEPNETVFKVIQQELSKANYTTLYLAPRGIGPTGWRVDERKLTQIYRRFMLLGRTIDGMRVWDVRRAIQTLRSLDSLKSVPIVLKGRSQMAGLVLYASLFEPNIARLDLWHLPHSHHDGPTFLNVLRYLDMPQTLAMAAERSQIHLYQKDDFQWQFPHAVIQKLAWPQDQFQAHTISQESEQ